MNYKELLQRKYPECSFTLDEPTDYDTLQWSDSNICSKPTKEWCDEKISKLQRIALRQCVSSRQSAYPPISDQLDMLWHAIDEGTLDKTSDFYQSLKAVKDSFPKP